MMTASISPRSSPSESNLLITGGASCTWTIRRISASVAGGRTPSHSPICVFAAFIGASPTTLCHKTLRQNVDMVNSRRRALSDLVHSSIVLPDVSVCFVKQFLVGMQFKPKQRSPKLLLNQTFSLACMLPIRKPHLLNNLIDVGDNPLDDD